MGVARPANMALGGYAQRPLPMNILGITLVAVLAFSDPWQALGPI
jgi:hypothetical protein